MPPAQITGRAIGQGLQQGLGRMMEIGIGAEIIYSFVIIACSLIIYFATKELYELTQHKGIKYFRLSFLYFALAYFFRSFIKSVVFIFDLGEIRKLMPLFFGNITLFIFIYFSVMAIFFLLYSVMWKKWENKYIIYVFHITSIVISLVMTVSGFSSVNYLFLNLLLLLFILYAVYTSYHESRKKKALNLYIIYLLLSVFWIFNILDILVPNFFQAFKLFVYLVSIGIFLAILYKVIKKTGN